MRKIIAGGLLIFLLVAGYGLNTRPTNTDDKMSIDKPQTEKPVTEFFPQEDTSGLLSRQDIQISSDAGGKEEGNDYDSIEYKIWEIISAEEQNATDIKFVCESIRDINWAEYDKIDHTAISLLDWIDDLDYGVSQKLEILYNTRGLDGAYSEKYASIVGSIFLENMEETIRFLGDKNNASQTTEIIDLISYYCAYFNIDKILDELQSLDLSNMTNGEEIRQEFIKEMEAKREL